jgi:hypothetical protein
LVLVSKVIMSYSIQLSTQLVIPITTGYLVGMQYCNRHTGL